MLSQTPSTTSELMISAEGSICESHNLIIQSRINSRHVLIFPLLSVDPRQFGPFSGGWGSEFSRFPSGSFAFRMCTMRLSIALPDQFMISFYRFLDGIDVEPKHHLHDVDRDFRRSFNLWKPCYYIHKWYVQRGVRFDLYNDALGYPFSSCNSITDRNIGSSNDHRDYDSRGFV